MHITGSVLLHYYAGCSHLDLTRMLQLRTLLLRTQNSQARHARSSDLNSIFEAARNVRANHTRARETSGASQPLPSRRPPPPPPPPPLSARSPLLRLPGHLIPSPAGHTPHVPSVVAPHRDGTTHARNAGKAVRMHACTRQREAISRRHARLQQALAKTDASLITDLSRAPKVPSLPSENSNAGELRFSRFAQMPPAKPALVGIMTMLARTSPQIPQRLRSNDHLPNEYSGHAKLFTQT